MFPGEIIAFALFIKMGGQSRWYSIFGESGMSHVQTPNISKIYELAVSLLVDSRYPIRSLETAFRMVFGSTQSIIDCSKASEMSALVVMPATTIRDVSACIFTNYNGVGSANGVVLQLGMAVLMKRKKGGGGFTS